MVITLIRFFKNYSLFANKANKTIHIQIILLDLTNALKDKNITIPDNSESFIRYTQELPDSDHTNQISVTYKRPASVSTNPSSLNLLSLKHNPSPKSVIIPLNSKRNLVIKNKKFRTRSRLNSSPINNYDNLDEQIEPCQDLFIQNLNTTVSLKAFKYIIENVSNKNIKIHDPCKLVGTN